MLTGWDCRNKIGELFVNQDMLENNSCTITIECISGNLKKQSTIQPNSIVAS